MRTLSSTAALLIALALFVGCGPKPKNNIADGGEEDAGEGVVDAGRPAGQMPPTGYSLALAADAGASTHRVGVGLAMALDQHDQPMLAYVEEDPNGDGVRQDDRVLFTRWNGELAQWQAPKMLEVCGELNNAPPHRPVAIARDATTGKLAVAYATAAGKLKLATSDDEGASWSLEAVNLPNTAGHALGDPSLALAAGTVHLTYWEASARCSGPGCGSLHYRKRQGSGPGGFGGEILAPLPFGTDAQLELPSALALDSAGAPGVAFFAGSSTSPTVTLGFWRPGSASSSVAFDSGSTADAQASVSLAFQGDKPRLAYHLASAQPGVQLRYHEATDAAGTVWASPVAIPRNGAISAPEGTAHYQGLSVDGAGKISLVAAFTLATQPAGQCGGPKLARSTDGLNFTVCSPDGGRVFGYAGTFVSLARANNGKLSLAFLYESTSNPTIGAGLVLWREP